MKTNQCISINIKLEYKANSSRIYPSEFAFYLITLHQSDLLPKPMSPGHIHESFPLTPAG